jgi:lipopolysaccharide heptosyltransferase II
LFKKTNRILIVNPFGIGDVLFSTPLISNLKRHYPDLYLGYLCNQRTKDLLELNPDINQLFIWEKDYFRSLWPRSKLRALKEFIHLLRQLKQANFELALDLSLNSEYSFFLSLIGIKQRIGYNFKNSGRFLTKKINLDGYLDKPIADYYLDLLKFINKGIKVTDKNLIFPLSLKDIYYADYFLEQHQLKNSDFLIGLIPGGGASWGKEAIYKQWDTHNFTLLADTLIEHFSAKIIIFGDSKDYPLCEVVRQQMKNKAVLAADALSLRQFAALLKKCHLVVCNDGGALHVAVSQGVRTISIFGPVDELLYGPYPSSPNHIVISKKLSCRPCYKKFKLSACLERPCLNSITPQEVVDAVKLIVSCPPSP